MNARCRSTTFHIDFTSWTFTSTTARSPDVSADVYVKHSPKCKHVFMSDLALDRACLQSKMFASLSFEKKHMTSTWSCQSFQTELRMRVSLCLASSAQRSSLKNLYAQLQYSARTSKANVVKTCPRPYKPVFYCLV